MTKAKQTRERILCAAMQYMLQNDAQQLTLEAVAAEADISKGGLLYHFPSKAALLAGLTVYIYEQFVHMVESIAASDPHPRGKWSRAWIRASQLDLDQHAKLNVGVMAQSLLEPDVAQKLSATYNHMQQRLDQDGTDPGTAAIIRLTIDGLYFAEMFRIAPLERGQRQAVIERLLAMTR